MKKAVKYKVTVSIDSVHKHMDREIEEIWIPELEACVNAEGFAFDSDSPRAKGGVEIEIDDISYDFVRDYLSAKDALDVAVRAMFK